MNSMNTMNKRGCVILLRGDEAISSAIAEGMREGCQLLSATEARKAEAQYGVMRRRDSAYWQEMIDQAEREYGDNRPLRAPARYALLAWAGLCEEIRGWYEWLRDWWVR